MISRKENAHCQESRERENTTFLLTNLETSQFFGTFDFGAVLGGFGEAKILDVRIVFDVFSKLISKRVRESEKMHQNPKKAKFGAILGQDCGGPQAPGERL